MRIFGKVNNLTIGGGILHERGTRIYSCGDMGLGETLAGGLSREWKSKEINEGI